MSQSSQDHTSGISGRYAFALFELIQEEHDLNEIEKINNFESFNSFLDFVNALENAFTIDQNISIVEATNLLWNFRDLDLENVNKLTVPTYNYTTQNGAQVLILDQNFFEFISSQGLIDW